MTIHLTATEFTALRGQLWDVMLSSVESFLAKNDLGGLDIASFQRQHSSDIDSLVTEILTFGGDVWPANVCSIQKAIGERPALPAPVETTRPRRFSLVAK